MRNPGRNLPVTIILALFMTLLFVSLAICATRWGADYFPDVPLTTQDGRVVHFYSDLLKDKIVAIDLIYTQCQDACPLETARLAQVQRMLGDRVGKEIFFYSISIDPERDTPSELKAYAEKFHAQPGWLFLTGKQEDIQLIGKKLGLNSDRKLRSRDGHTSDLMIGNVASGQWMRNSATDNPRFLALMIGQFLTGWNNAASQNTKDYAQAQRLNLNQGQYLFGARCSACHTIGGGDSVGPDLLNITATRDPAWLARFIKTPDKLLADKDPIATTLFEKYKHVQMPNLRLGNGDVDAIIQYLNGHIKQAVSSQSRMQEINRMRMEH
jgi:protein SCO1